jgi:hypothetical protein
VWGGAQPFRRVWDAAGFYAHTREENGIDANRDFPYMEAGARCMRTLAARAINEVLAGSRTHAHART